MQELQSFVHLIDFIGHPSLNEDYLNKRRFDTLLSLIYTHKVFVASTFPEYEDKWSQRSLYRERYIEIKEKAVRDKNCTWIEISDKIDIFELASILAEHGFKITPGKTSVIIGGTNLGGCILYKKKTSLYDFAKAGFNTQIYLPMCAEADGKGLNDLEKTLSAIAKMYDFIKNEKITQNVDLVYKEKHLVI